MASLDVHLAEDSGDDPGGGWEKHIATFEGMSSMFKDMQNAHTQLKAQCQALRKQKETLESDIKGKSNEIENLIMDRDSLRVEYNRAQSENTWWNNRALSSSTSTSTSNNNLGVSSSSSSLLLEGDVQGKLNRRIWLLEEKVKSLQDSKISMKNEYEDEIERERAISSGLRDRISDLESKRKQIEKEKQTYEKEISSTLSRIQAENEDNRKLNDQLKIAKEDLIDTQQKERKELAKLRDEAVTLKAEKARLEAECQRLKQEKTVPVESVRSPPRILQSQDLNIPLSQPLSSQGLSSQPKPVTPTKSKSYKPFTPLLNSPSTTSNSLTALIRDNAYLKASLEHQTAVHQSLKNEHDKLRKLHKEDIDHMKKYQASQIERKKKKEERKAKKKFDLLIASQAQAQYNSNMTDGDGQISSGRTITHEPPVQEMILVEESESLPSKKKSGPKQKDHGFVSLEEQEYLAHAENEYQEEPDEQNDQEDQTAEPRINGDNLLQVMEDIDLMERNRAKQSPAAREHAATQKPDSSHEYQPKHILEHRNIQKPSSALEYRRSGSPTPIPSVINAQNRDTLSTPKPDTTQQKKAVKAAHITPWLGVEQFGSSSTSTARQKKKQDISTNSDDDFASPPSSQDIATPIRAPMVRDRTGETTLAVNDSLRKSVMKRTFAHDHLDAATPVRAERNAIPGPSNYQETPFQSKPTVTRTASNTSIVDSSGKKRKILDLETEGLSPSEKALKLKKLAKMPVSAKRELYASYKGKGRYTKPEDINKTVNEDFEINPLQNEGNNFAYHDVRRKKSERKNMHGGDCECCKGYYESVGEVPRYNQGPKWRDETDQIEKEEGEAVREHQNMVSRHRETWIRPPTPPGYWKIGFPSTQDVEEQNQQADRMLEEKEERIRKEAL
ncbi:uncharacterized protein L201_006697 [Kwoniella dendrophila CBS 6074]|uniref:DNA endonuclease activator Ctp1 C-terminal domain-containing protein n=1 Tax=Kwoniella dendrophila CBS 6074 TaxID=1295534 RepID=A0AAX4K2A7_9TREE